MRIALVAMILAGSPAFAQVSASVSVVAPPPPRVVVTAPPPPRVVMPPPVVVAPPPEVRVEAPSVRFEARPPLVVAAPGVQVVQDCDEEVFYVGGWYWHPGPHGWWYRTRSYRGGWVAVPPRAVPVRLVHLPPGQYRHFRGEARRPLGPRVVEREERGPGGWHGHGEGRGEDHGRGEARGHGKHGRW